MRPERFDSLSRSASCGWLPYQPARAGRSERPAGLSASSGAAPAPRAPKPHAVACARDTCTSMCCVRHRGQHRRIVEQCPELEAALFAHGCSVCRFCRSKNLPQNRPLQESFRLAGAIHTLQNMASERNTKLQKQQQNTLDGGRPHVSGFSAGIVYTPRQPMARHPPFWNRTDDR